MDTRYITSAAKPEQLPNYRLPEFALIGRSNSGKSTLLNGIMAHKALARTSSTPGRTQLIHFFGMGEQLIIADLPGYGYSKISRDARALWDPLVDAYLERPNIREFLFLMDCRRQPDEMDAEILYRLGAHRDVVVVLTKIDKLGKNDLMRSKQSCERAIEGIPGISAFLAVSSLKKEGIRELQNRILKISKEK